MADWRRLTQTAARRELHLFKVWGRVETTGGAPSRRWKRVWNIQRSFRQKRLKASMAAYFADIRPEAWRAVFNEAQAQ